MPRGSAWTVNANSAAGAESAAAVAVAVVAGSFLAPGAASAFDGMDLVAAPMGLVNTGLNLYKYALGTYAIMSWLYSFGILDRGNDIVAQVQGFLSAIIDPVLGPLRNVIPPLAGFDISFMILWFVIEQAQAAAVAIMVGAMTYGVAEQYVGFH